MEENLPKSEILEGCKNNNRKYQEILYKAYYPLLMGMVKDYIKDPGEAEKCLNQGFLTIFKRIGKYDYKTPFEEWLSGFIRKSIKEYLKIAKTNVK